MSYSGVYWDGELNLICRNQIDSICVPFIELYPELKSQLQKLQARGGKTLPRLIRQAYARSTNKAWINRIIQNKPQFAAPGVY